ncbi:hypothetical protein NQ317_013682 [Molorchus minor]|uniref:Uncharacterized protein n=1 Tax=Molorchus minor TaxID=1323400 RepID=A0ABQ9JBH6_9CUCU|nr:hypothetical protein NQ317_013682 [Molorchus minor]
MVVNVNRGKLLFVLVQLVLSNYKHNQKSRFYDFLHDWLGKGLLTSSEIPSQDSAILPEEPQLLKSNRRNRELPNTPYATCPMHIRSG